MTIFQERSPQDIHHELTLPDRTPIPYSFRPQSHRWVLLETLTVNPGPILMRDLVNLIHPGDQPTSAHRRNVRQDINGLNKALKSTGWQVRSTTVLENPGIKRIAYFLAHSD